MLDESFVKHSVAINTSDVLIVFKRSLELRNIALSNDFFLEHLTKHIVERILFYTFFFVQDT